MITWLHREHLSQDERDRLIVAYAEALAEREAGEKATGGNGVSTGRSSRRSNAGNQPGVAKQAAKALGVSKRRVKEAVMPALTKDREGNRLGKNAVHSVHRDHRGNSLRSGLTSSMLRDLMREVENDFDQHGEILHYGVCICRIRSLRSRFGMSIFISEHTNFMCPFHHDGRKDKAIFDANAELASFAETAKRINLSTDQFQGLRYAGGLNGIGGKDFDKGIQDFVEKLNDARHQETDLGKGSRNPVFKTQRLNDGASPVTADRRIGPMPKRRTENVEDPDNPEWTDAMFARSKPASALPPEIRSAFPKTLRARRLSKRTTETVMFHLDKEVLDFYRTGEEDWQTRINDALIEAMRAAKNGSRSSGS